MIFFYYILNRFPKLQKKMSEIFYLNSNTFSFISGIYISATVAICIRLVFDPDKIGNVGILGLTILLMFLSSILWLSISIELQPLQQPSKFDTYRKGTGKTDELIWENYILQEKIKNNEMTHIVNLFRNFVLSIVFSIMAIIFLCWSYLISSIEQSSIEQMTIIIISLCNYS